MAASDIALQPGQQQPTEAGKKQQAAEDVLSLEEFVSVLRQLPALAGAEFDPATGLLAPVPTAEGGTFSAASLHKQLAGVSKSELLRCLTAIFNDLAAQQRSLQSERQLPNQGEYEPVALDRVFPLAKQSRSV